MICPRKDHCPDCTRAFVDAGPDYLDQSQLTRLPARRFAAEGCPHEVVTTLRVEGARWEAYPSAKGKTP